MDKLEDALASEECRIILGVIGGILSDESFGLPTEGNKLCLDMAETLAKCFSVGPSEQAVEFASWLVGRLDGVIIETQKEESPMD